MKNKKNPSRFKPKKIASTFQVCFPNDVHLVAGGCSGKLCVWDLRQPVVEREISPFLDLNGSKEENGEALVGCSKIRWNLLKILVF